MSNRLVTLTVGSRIPVFSGEITRPEGLAFDLEEDDISEVRLRVRPKAGSSYVIDEEVDSYTLSGDGKTLSFSYAWQDGDTDTAGSFLAQLRVRLTDGRDAYAPTHRGIAVELRAQI